MNGSWSGSTSAAWLADATWVTGRWVERAADLAADAAYVASAPVPSPEGAFGGERVPRADRVTQLAALVVARAVAAAARAGAPPCAPDALGVITASTLATAHTNERFERRRSEGRLPEPRVFPYTAPNAAGGEVALALRARGPSLALVGGAEVALAALERACAWLARGQCERVVVVAVECPPATPSAVAPPGVAPVECASAAVLHAGSDALFASWPRLVTRWRAAHANGANGANGTMDAVAHGPLLSVEAVARVALAARGAGDPVVVAATDAGAWLEATIDRVRPR